MTACETCGDEVEVARQRSHVVAGQLERVVLVGDLDAPVLGSTNEEVLELGPHLQLVAERLCPGEGVPQDRARAVRPRLALDRDIAGEPRHVLLPGQDRERRRVRHGDHVGVVRALSDVAGREPSEPGALG